MKDFSQPYRNVAFFGLNIEESAHDKGASDAWDIVIAAAKRTYNYDIRTDELEEALVYLEQHRVRPAAFHDFRKALGIKDPVMRMQGVYHALQRIRREIAG